MAYTFCTNTFIKDTNLWPGQHRGGQLVIYIFDQNIFTSVSLQTIIVPLVLKAFARSFDTTRLF